MWLPQTVLVQKIRHFPTSAEIQLSAVAARVIHVMFYAEFKKLANYICDIDDQKKSLLLFDAKNCT